MKVLGIIAEYNPFHNGHKYQLEQARMLTGADYIIVVMSGDYVQRGAPAIYDKYHRTEVALKQGIDLVLELPSLFASSSAAEFSSSAVALLDQLGVVDTLCFGSESGNISMLSEIAAALNKEPVLYQQYLKENLKNGETFPQARAKAFAAVFQNPEAFEIMNQPNNILGLEYLSALQQRNSSMVPITVARKGHGYHDQTVDEQFISATAIRNVIEKQEQNNLIDHKVPDETTDLIKNGQPLFLNDFSSILNLRLLQCFESGAALEQYLDLSEELSDRLKKMIYDFALFEERIMKLKTRQFTYTRISRALLHLMMGITKSQLEAAKELDYVPYARVLGFNHSAQPLLKAIKDHSSVPMITKAANAEKILNPDCYWLFKQTMHHSHIYQSVYFDKYNMKLKNEYTAGCIRI